jgi:hypothetical protein
VVLEAVHMPVPLGLRNTLQVHEDHMEGPSNKPLPIGIELLGQMALDHQVCNGCEDKVNEHQDGDDQ